MMRDNLSFAAFQVTLSTAMDNALFRMSSGELKQTHLGGWGEEKRKASEKQSYKGLYWRVIPPTEVGP